MAGNIVHFDIPAEDVARSVDFYRHVMGWAIEKYEGEGPEYWLVFPEPGNYEVPGGGIGKKEMPEQANVNYYQAEGGLEAFNRRVREKGGTVITEKMPIPGWGWLSVCQDPEGNLFGGWVDDKEAG